MSIHRQVACAATAVAVSLLGAFAFANPPTPDQLAVRARVARQAANEAKQAQAREMRQWADQTAYGSPRAGWQLDLIAAEAASRATERAEVLEQRARAAQKAADQAKADPDRASHPIAGLANR